MGVNDADGFVHLLLKLLLVLEKGIGIAGRHLKEHTSDLGCKVWNDLGNLDEQALTQSNLLVLHGHGQELLLGNRSERGGIGSNGGRSLGCAGDSVLRSSAGTALDLANHLAVRGHSGHLPLLVGAGTTVCAGLLLNTGDEGHEGKLAHEGLDALLELHLKHAVTLIAALGDVDNEGLAVEHATVHLPESSVGLLSLSKANKTETTAGSFLVSHDLAALDLAKLDEEVLEVLILELRAEVAHVEVVSGGLALHVLSPELNQTLIAGLGTLDIEVLFGGSKTVDSLVVELLNGFDGVFVLIEVAESKNAALAVLLGAGAGDTTKLAEEFLDGSLINGGKNLLNIHISEVEHEGSNAGITTNEVSDVQSLILSGGLLVTVKLGDSLLSGVIGLEVNKTIAAAGAILVAHNLAGEDGAKVLEQIVKLLAINGITKVLNENVARAGVTSGGVALLVHEANVASLNLLEVKSLKGFLSISRVLEVHVTITERTASNNVATNADTKDCTAGLEEFKKLGLGNSRSKVTNVNGGDSRRKRGGLGDFFSHFEDKRICNK